MLPWMAGDSITVLDGAVGGDYGDDQDIDWSDPTVTGTIDGCSVQPLPAGEYTLDRNAVVSRWQVWAPPNDLVTSLRRVRWNGDDYEVDGSVQNFPDPTGVGLDHQTFLLRRVTG